MKLFLIFCILSSTFALEWWENANYYQIYPKSYLDSDNDGIGDLAGIKSKIPYLKDLGMDAVWLSSIFKSSGIDGGYDITNFTEIDPIFGTMQDFEDLLKAFKDNEIRLILDFVPNHSSNKHEWFLKSERKENGYEDYYIWHKGKPIGNNRSLVSSNWRSVYRGSAWKWSDVRKEYYLHQFEDAQPDLNYRNPAVVTEMKNVLKFWLDKGIDGFRVHGTQYLFEIETDENGDYPDEPLSGNCVNPLDHCYLSHIYTQNYPETYDMVYQWREVLDQYKDSPRILITEAYTSLENIMKYYGDGKRKGSHIPLNYDFLSSTKDTDTAREIIYNAEYYINHLPTGHNGNWILGNHDQSRIYSRLGGFLRAEFLNIFLQTMPGSAFTYQGEEILMADAILSYEDTQDPLACNTNNISIFRAYSRDPARTPMQWENSTIAGFNNGTKPWLPFGWSYKLLNVADQEKSDNSALKMFKQLVKLHKLPAFREGSYESATNVDENMLSYIRTYGKDSYLVAINFDGKKEIAINFKKSFQNLRGETGKVVVSTFNLLGKKIHMNKNLSLSIYEGIVVKVNGAETMVVSSIMLLATIFITFFRNFTI